jgi:phage gpG-like protein
VSRVNYSVDASEAIALVDEIKTAMKSYVGPLTEAGEFLEAEFAVNFASDGSQVGGWAPLSPYTTNWRVKHGYGPAPTLVNDGDLAAAVFSLKHRVGNKGASFAVDNEVAGFHQFGTRHMPARRIVFEPPGFAELMARRVAGHIVPNGATNGLTRLFT